MSGCSKTFHVQTIDLDGEHSIFIAKLRNQGIFVAMMVSASTQKMFVIQNKIVLLGTTRLIVSLGKPSESEGNATPSKGISKETKRLIYSSVRCSIETVEMDTVHTNQKILLRQTRPLGSVEFYYISI